MRKLAFIFLIVSIFSCGGPEKEATTVVHAAVNTQTTKPIVKFQKDSIKPKAKKNPYVITDPARPKSAIKTAFPFDIALKSPDGKAHTSSDILKANGKPTVVLFWLTTCYPCRIEMKAIQDNMDQWKKETDFNIVAISTDFEKNFDNFVKMVEKNQWSFESYWDQNREFRKVMPGELNGLPQSFIFDKDGNIAYHKRKYSTGDEHKLYAKVKELAAN